MVSCLPFPALCPPSLAPGHEAPEEYGAAVEGGQVSSLPRFPVTSLSGRGLRVDQAPSMAWSPLCTLPQVCGSSSSLFGALCCHEAQVGPGL